VPSPAVPPPRRTLVIGGARSGKSGYAERIVSRDDGSVRYIATARRHRDDLDFEQRIAAHRDRRPANWAVVESAEHSLPDLLREASTAATLVDDVGTWLTTVIDDAGAWEQPRGTVAAQTDALVAAVADHSGRLVMVTPEVGQGVIPASASGRLFRDELGELNQRLAAVSDEVLLIVAGRALRLE
jgi:adenosylcobinamide kinase/adenosylcobinamide-phosphate guanylyltransferase